MRKMSAESNPKPPEKHLRLPQACQQKLEPPSTSAAWFCLMERPKELGCARNSKQDRPGGRIVDLEWNLSGQRFSYGIKRWGDLKGAEY